MGCSGTPVHTRRVGDKKTLADSLSKVLQELNWGYKSTFLRFINIHISGLAFMIPAQKACTFSTHNGCSSFRKSCICYTAVTLVYDILGAEDL